MKKANPDSGWALLEKRGYEWQIYIGWVRRTRAEIIYYARHKLVMPADIGKPWPYIKKRYGFRVVRVRVEEE